MFDHQAVVGGQIRLALGTVDDKELRFLSRRRRQLHVSREGRSAQTYDSAVRYPLYDFGRRQGYIPDDVRCTVYGFLPLVTFHVYDHVHHRIARQVGVWLDGSDGTRHGTVDIGGNKSCGSSYQLSCPDLVTLLYERLGGSSQMLGHGYVHPLRQRECLYR